MHSLKRSSTLVALIALFAAFAGPTLSAPPVDVELDLVIDRPATEGVLSLELTFYRIRWDAETGMNVPDQAFNQWVEFRPQQGVSDLRANFTLQSGEIYQFLVHGYDQTGNPWMDATYYYAPEFFAGATEKTVKLVAGETNEIRMSLAKSGLTTDKGNFLDIFVRPDGEYLAMYNQADKVFDRLYR